MLLKFVDLTFPGGTGTSSTYLNHHLINVEDVGMAKDSKYSMLIFAMIGETGEPMAAPCNCL